MTTADIDPTAPPTEKRCTAQIFQPASQFNFALLLTINPDSPLQLLGTSEDPPAIIFDGIYAGAILYHFGTQELKDAVSQTWRDIFYPNGAKDTAHADQKEISNKQVTVQAVEQTQIQQHTTSHDTYHSPDTFDMLMVLPYVMVPQNELHATLRGAREEVEAVDQRHVQEKVNQWIRKVEAA